MSLLQGCGLFPRSGSFLYLSLCGRNATVPRRTDRGSLSLHL